jgi:hypothetical protein
MLHFTRLVYPAILLATLVYGRPDSAINEPAVSAPDGVVETDTRLARRIRSLLQISLRTISKVEALPPLLQHQLRRATAQAMA